ncbi:MAG: TetR/AcrR family transcriptional regulator [Thermoleophilaceae bacterium]
MKRCRLTRAEKKAETRASLLEAAAEVFARQGFQAASVDEVAEAAGFTKGAVYAHFESKEDLFLAVLDERFADRLGEVRALLDSDGEPQAQARKAGEGFMDYLDADPRWTPLFFEFWAHAVRNPEVATKLVPRYRAVREAVAEAIDRRALELGYEPPQPLDEVAAMTFAMANGAALEHALEPEAIPAGMYGRMLEIFFRGLMAIAEDDAAAQPRSATSSR